MRLKTIFFTFLFFFLIGFLRAHINSVQELRKIFDEHSVIMLFVNSDTGQILDANKAATEFYGYTSNQLKMMSVGDLLQKDSSTPNTYKVYESWKGNNDLSIPIQEHELACGTIRTVETHSSGITIGNERISLIIIHDITERVEALILLEESEISLRKAEKMAKFGYWYFYLDERIFMASEGAAEIYGISADREAVPVEIIQSMALSQHREKLDEALFNLINNQVPYDVKFKITNQENNRIIDIHSIAEYDPSQNLIFGIIRDITSEVSTGEALKRRTSLFFLFLGLALVFQFIVIYFLITSLKKKKQAELSLSKSERHYRLLAENTAECIFLYSFADNRFKYISPSVFYQRGLNVDEAQKESLYESFTPTSAEELKSSLEKRRVAILSGEESQNYLFGVYELQQIKKDSSVFDIELSTTLLENKNKEELELLGVIRDISERKKNEKELLESLLRHTKQKKLLEDLSNSDNLNNGEVEKFVNRVTVSASELYDAERVSVWLFDKDYKQLKCLDLYEKTLNCHSKDMVLHREHFENEFKNLQHSLYVNADNPARDNRTSGYTDSYLKPLNITSMLDASIRVFGRIMGILCIEHVNRQHHWKQDEISFACQLAALVATAFNNGKRNLAEMNLKLEKSKLRKIIEAIPNSLIVLDRNGLIIEAYLNPSQVFLNDTKDLSGFHLRDVMIEKDSEEIVLKIQQCLQEKEIQRHDFKFNKDHFFEFYEVTINPINENYVLTVFRNVTDQRKTEQQLIEQNKELAQLNYVTSHDMRTPLVNIQGFSGELSKSVKNILDLIKSLSAKNSSTAEEKAIISEISTIIVDEIDSYLKYIKVSTEKMDTLINGLLIYSRQSNIKPQPEIIDMDFFIKDIKKTVDFKLKSKNIKIDIGKLPDCYADRNLLTQVVSNLIENSVKYSKQDTPGYLKIYGVENNGFTTYYFQDNGIGIKSEYHKKIFELFHQLKPGKSPGEGIGLAIAKKNIYLMKGEIGVESEPGKGSTFYFSLPSVLKHN